MGDADFQKPARRLHVSFSLRGLMVIVSGTAVGMAVTRLEAWPEGLLAAVACWIAIGLAHQARDLAGTYWAGRDMARDERWGWRCMIGWRLAAILVMVTYYLTAPVRQTRVDTAGRTSYEEHLRTYEPDELHECLLLLAIFLVLWSVVGPRAPRGARTRRQRLVSGAAWCLGVIACLIIWQDQSMVYALVYFMLWDLEISRLPALHIPGIAPYLAGRAEPFVFRSAVAAACVLANAALVWQLARHWRLGTLQRLTLLALLAVPLAVTVSHTVWLHTLGTYGLSATWHEGFIQMGMCQWPAEAWAALVMLAVIVTSFVTCRLIWAAEGGSSPAEFPEQPWRSRYYHESRCCMLVLMVAMLTQTGMDAWENSYSVMSFRVIRLFTWPLNYLRAAIVVLALRAFLRLGSGPQRPVASVRLDPIQLAVLWPAVFLVVASGAVTLAWAGFAIWLAPFCRWP